MTSSTAADDCDGPAAASASPNLRVVLAVLLLSASPLGAQLAAAEGAAAPATKTGVASEPTFEDWVTSFREEAVRQGVSRTVAETHLRDLTINERVFELNDNQPEFTKAIWEYLDGAVSDRRLGSGRERFAAERPRLAQIEENYAVDAEVLVAIWGLESSFGAIMGDHDAIAALATLAWKGRRTDYGRSQLIGALKIIENGYAGRDELRGSWAGAMGQTQFIPTTYLSYAVDADGDGRRDIWSNLDDVFASTANYLAKSGYKKDAPWGVEVRLPDRFDYAASGPGVYRPIAEWAGLGVEATRGALAEDHDLNARPRLLLPAGANGPAYLVFGNFEAILKYNRSSAYALAVGMLAEGVAERPFAPAADWPRGDRALSLSERMALQEALAAAGHDPGPADGVIGANTQKALRAWQKATGRPADGYASAATLEALTGGARAESGDGSSR